MSYFHVLIAFEGDANKFECPFQDLSEDKLKSDFVSAYQAGTNIFHNGVVIKTNEIAKVKIVETGQNCELELKNLQEKSRREIDEINRNSYATFIGFGRGYETSDLEELGIDVTSNYIHGAPGYKLKQEVSLSPSLSSQPSIWVRIINHQWFVNVFGGIIVAVIVYLLIGN
jgi:hypothetical protein